MKKLIVLIILSCMIGLFSVNNTNAQTVGIGQASFTPATLLHMKNTAAATDAIFRIENTIATQKSGINFLNSGTASATWLFYVPASSTNLRLQAQSGTDILTFYNTGDALVNNASFYGNLGINNAGANNLYGINITGAPSGWHGVHSDLTGLTTNYAYYATSSAALSTASLYVKYGLYADMAATNSSTGGITNYGIYSYAHGSGGSGTNLNYGIYAAASGGSTNFAGYFSGDALITANTYINSTSNGEIHYGSTGLFGATTTWNPDPTPNDGLWFEGSNGESGGMFVNGDCAVIWSPGDNDILRVYDEDDFGGGPKFVLDGAGDVGIGISAPDDKLDVVGNAQISGYLKVGNPTAPSSTAGGTWATFYASSLDAGAAGWSQNRLCGDVSTEWTFSFTTNNGVLTYNNFGTRSYNYLYSPVIWIPAGVTSINNEGHFACTLENNFDGVFLEYSVNGGAWTKITVFTYASYPDNASGSTTDCLADGTAQSCWNGTVNGPFRCSVGTAGAWIRFRFVGMEDNLTNTGNFQLYGFSVGGVLPGTVGGAFAAGNIYAEKNVYAGSNVLIGDIAEYFNVDVATEPGDLIVLIPDKVDVYSKSSSAYCSDIIGIHSTNPTVTVNSPNAGTPVCLTGRVPVKVCNQTGTIKIGDYLTSSSIPGVAMKADKPCYVIGKALDNFEDKEGKILCLTNAGWYNPVISQNASTQNSGSFYFKKGNAQIIVNDNAIKSNSKIFITFRGNAGSHWVSDIRDGSFILNINTKPETNILFDYFIENAAISSINENRLLSDENSKVDNLMNKKLISASENNNQSMKNITLPEYTPGQPPTDPPDLTKAWTWDKINGFVEQKIETTNNQELNQPVKDSKEMQEKNNNQQLNPKDTEEKQDDKKQ